MTAATPPALRRRRPPPAGRKTRRDDHESARGRDELPDERLRLEVVAAHEGSQADRAALSVLHHGLLRAGWIDGGADPARAADPGRRPDAVGDLQQGLHDARDPDGLLLPDSVDPGHARQLPDPDDDRRQGPGVPRINLLSWYIYFVGGRSRCGPSSPVAWTRAGRSTRRTAPSTATRKVIMAGLQASSSPAPNGFPS